MNLEMSSDEEDDSSTSTVASGDEGIRRLERMMLASSTPGTLKDTVENQLAPDKGWGQVRPAFADLQSGGGTKTTWTIARHIFREYTPPQRGEDAQSDPNGETQVNFAILQCLNSTFGIMNLQESSDNKDDSNISTEASSDKKMNEGSSIVIATETFPGGGHIKGSAVVAEAVTGQAHANEVLRKCHEAGKEIDEYKGGDITTYPVSELVLLRFVGRMNKYESEIYKGTYKVVDHYGRNGRRRITRAHRYIEHQYLEEGESNGIIFMDLSIEQEAFLLLNIMHPGKGIDRWDRAWGTFPVVAAYPKSP